VFSSSIIIYMYICKLVYMYQLHWARVDLSLSYSTVSCCSLQLVLILTSML
jgi:hypothetical protein